LTRSAPRSLAASAGSGGRHIDWLQCVLGCLSESNTLLLLSAILGSATAFFFLFITWRRFELLIAGQAATASAIVVLLVSMRCPMLEWIWVYLGIVSSGLLILSLVRYLLAREAHTSTTSLSSYVEALEEEFGVAIRVIDTQKIRAFAHQGAIYLSVGLLERLERDEVKAVAAHETYHLKHSPNKFISSMLAVGSLTFFSFNDDHLADHYAASFAGKDALVRALKRLEIAGSGQRIKEIFSST